MRITILVLFLFHNVFSQNIEMKQEFIDPSQIYNVSFIKYIEMIKDKGEIIVEYNGITTAFIDEKKEYFDSLNIKLVNKEYLQKRSKKSKLGVIYYRIVPLQIDNEGFYINIIPFRMVWYKREYENYNMYGKRYDYIFDCKSNCFVQKI